MPSLKLRIYLGSRNKEGTQSHKDNWVNIELLIGILDIPPENLQEVGPNANVGKVVGIDPPS